MQVWFGLVILQAEPLPQSGREDEQGHHKEHRAHIAANAAPYIAVVMHATSHISAAQYIAVVMLVTILYKEKGCLNQAVVTSVASHCLLHYGDQGMSTQYCSQLWIGKPSRPVEIT